LFARTGNLSHIAPCLELMKASRTVYDEVVWTALPLMFRSLLTSGAMQLSVVELRGADGPALVAFCGSLFVADSFCREACAPVTPYLGEEVARRYLDQRLPVLERDAIAFLNGRAGVSVVVCY
jgi:hypothetical protein